MPPEEHGPQVAVSVPSLLVGGAGGEAAWAGRHGLTPRAGVRPLGAGARSPMGGWVCP